MRDRAVSVRGWATMLVVGLTSAVVTGVALGSEGRRVDSLPADDALTVGIVAWLVAMTSLVGVTIATVPRGQAAQAGTVAATVVVVLLAGFLVLRLAVWTGGDRGFSAEQATLGVVGMALVLALVIVVAVRCRRAAMAARR